MVRFTPHLKVYTRYYGNKKTSEEAVAIVQVRDGLP